MQLQPLFLFVRSRLAPVSSLTQLQGLRIMMPPEASATSQAALVVLRLAGVSQANTSLQFQPLADAVAALRKGATDAGIFMLDPCNALIVAMLQDTDLHLVSFNEGEAISRQLPFLQLATLPRGSLAVGNHVPPEDTTLLAASVNVVIRRDLHPGVLYPLLEAMKEVHHGATLVSDLGAFPSLAGTELLPHPLAVDYFRGGLPWMYCQLPLPIASLVDKYFVIGIALPLLAEIYKNLKYLRELANAVIEHCCLHPLSMIERETARGHAVGRLRLLAVRLAERALASTSKR